MILRAKYACTEVYTLRPAQEQNTCANGYRVASPQLKDMPVVTLWKGRGSEEANVYQPQITSGVLPELVAGRSCKKTAVVITPASYTQ